MPHSLPDGRALAVTVTWRPSASVHMHSHGARLFFWNPAGMLGGRACLAQFPGQSFPRAVSYRQLSCRPWEATALGKTSPGLWKPFTVAADGRSRCRPPARFPGCCPPSASTMAEFKNVGAGAGAGGAWHGLRVAGSSVPASWTSWTRLPASRAPPCALEPGSWRRRQLQRAVAKPEFAARAHSTLRPLVQRARSRPSCSLGGAQRPDPSRPRRPAPRSASSPR